MAAFPHVAAMPAKRAFVYILRCADQTFYTGIAKDVAARVAVHNARRGAKYTRARLPVQVVFQEGPMSLTRALRREYQLKQLTRLQKKALIAGRVVIKLPRR
jgi:predicted GIY-YIG superfamily endonuclease